MLYVICIVIFLKQLLFSFLQHLEKLTDSYMAFGDGPFVVDILKEMTSKSARSCIAKVPFKKCNIAGRKKQRDVMSGIGEGKMFGTITGVRESRRIGLFSPDYVSLA